MKKLLLAVGLTAMFGLAQAQSSVTVYGILDVGYVGSSYNGTGTSATTKQTANSFGSGAESASRLGFKGTEDLGGGTSAFFTVETGLTPESTTASTFNNRQSFAGIKKNGIGEVAFGLQYTPLADVIGATDPGARNGIVGSIINVGTPQTFGTPGLQPYAAATSPGIATDAYTQRASNSMTLKSDDMAGFKVNAMIAANNTNTTQTSATAGGPNNAYGYGLAATYSGINKVLLVAGYQQFKNNQVGTLTSPAPSLFLNSGAAGVNVQDSQTYLGGTYDFGIVKAYLGYINRKVTDTVNSAYTSSRSGQQVGVRGFITPAVEGFASYGTGKVTNFGVGLPSNNFTGYQVGSNYYLSKRTNLYAIYGQQQSTSAAGVSTAGSGNSANQYALGLRHTF
jgi:predicted porin